MADGVPSVFDRALVRAHRTRATRLDAGARNHEFLRKAVAEELLDRMLSITRGFERGLELGGGGVFSRLWAKRPEARAKLAWLTSSDLSEAQLVASPGLRVVLDEERLAVADGALDIVVSPLSLHWVDDLPGALVQIRRALKPDGVFLGAMLGGSTLTELRQSLSAAELELTGGAAARVSPFADVLDAAQLLQRAGFALPVADRDTIKVAYADPVTLLHDLRGMGETAAPANKPPRALTRRVLARAMEIYAERFSGADGRLRATFEVIHLSGWAPHESQPKPLRPGSAKVRLADALGTTERSAGDEASPKPKTE
jgi:SAM-dependent methyltransferase